MKKIIIFATAYPYAAGVIAVIWIGSAALLKVDSALSFNLVLFANIGVSLIVAGIGFRK